MINGWSSDRIQDPSYRAEFVDVPNVLADWMSEHGGLEGRDILDFGCGEGATTLGVALCHHPRRVVGIEILPKVWNTLTKARTQIGLDNAPDNFDLRLVTPSATLDDLGSFDFIYSWSVFEHVQRDLIADCLARMKRVLRPKGTLFLQTTPLFYSAYGSHFRPWIATPWAHLSMQHDLFCIELRKQVGNEEEAHDLLCMYENLNRATANRILNAAREVGLKIVREHRTYDDAPIPPDLREIYSEDVLRTNQLVFLAKHAD